MAGTNRPTQFGPRIRMRCARAASTSSCWSRAPAGLPIFSKARRHDYRGPCALPAQGRDQRWDRRGRRADDAQVSGLGQVIEVGIASGPGNRGVPRVDRHHSPLESAIEKIGGEHRTDGSRHIARTQNGDGAGIKKGLQVFDRHGSPLRFRGPPNTHLPAPGSRRSHRPGGPARTGAGTVPGSPDSAPQAPVAGAAWYGRRGLRDIP